METEKSKKKSARLGRGLSSLLQNTTNPKDALRQKLVEPPEEPPVDLKGKVLTVDIEKINPNPDQPRTDFNREHLEQLAASIKEKGIIQPIVVVKDTDKTYKIIAGERRWRASQIAGLHKVPVVLREVVDDKDILELALIENVQREDLNPIEEAKAYKNLQDKYGYTQSKISEKIGKDRVTIANSMRLLGLHEKVQKLLVDGDLSVGHAKVLLSVADAEKQVSLAKKVVNEKLNVRKTEQLVNAKEKAEDLSIDISAKLANSMAEDLQKVLSSKVKIDYKNKKGKISLFFYSDEELTEFVEALKRGWKKAGHAN